MREKRSQSTRRYHSLKDVLKLAEKLGYDVHFFFDSELCRCTVRVYHGDSMHQVFAFVSDDSSFVLERTWYVLYCIRNNILPF